MATIESFIADLVKELKKAKRWSEKVLECGVPIGSNQGILGELSLEELDVGEKTRTFNRKKLGSSIDGSHAYDDPRPFLEEVPREVWDISPGEAVDNPFKLLSAESFDNVPAQLRRLLLEGCSSSECIHFLNEHYSLNQWSSAINRWIDVLEKPSDVDQHVASRVSGDVLELFLEIGIKGKQLLLARLFLGRLSTGSMVAICYSEIPDNIVSGEAEAVYKAVARLDKKLAVSTSSPFTVSSDKTAQLITVEKKPANDKFV